MEEDYQQRVIEEKKELDEKIVNLRGFVGTEPFSKLSPRAQTLLMQQDATMRNYSHILADRIKLFEIDAEVEKAKTAETPAETEG